MNELIDSYKLAYRHCNGVLPIKVEYKRAHIFITHDCTGYVMTNKFTPKKVEAMVTLLEERIKNKLR